MKYFTTYLNQKSRNIYYNQPITIKRNNKNYRKGDFMNNIITTKSIETVTSMEVASMVDKDHNKLIRDIRRYINQLGEAKIGHTDFFQESTYISEQNKELPCFNITRKGCEFIANKLTGQKGTEFTARYVNRFHELEEGNVTNALINTLNSISQSMLDMKTEINERLTKLEEQQNKKKLPEKKYSRWKTNTFNKLNTLLSYVNEHSDENLKLSEVIHLVIGETEDTYNIEMNDYVDAYKSEFNLENNPYVIDVINHYKDIRDMFTLTLDSIMKKLHIGEKTSRQKKNIFDELAAMVDNK